jgi:hypothetical protein
MTEICDPGTSECCAGLTCQNDFKMNRRDESTGKIIALCFPPPKKMAVREAAPELAPLAIPEPKPEPARAAAVFERQCYGYARTYQFKVNVLKKNDQANA